MSLDANQFMDYAIVPVLDKMGLVLELPMNSIDACHLILGTFCAESQLTSLKQIRGPALGFGQCEEPTYEAMRLYAKNKGGGFYEKVVYCVYGEHYRALPPFEYLATDIRLQVVIARLKYWTIREPIPGTIEEQAVYWKKWYNTPLGKGTPQHYIDSYPHSMAF